MLSPADMTSLVENIFSQRTELVGDGSTWPLDRSNTDLMKASLELNVSGH